MNRENFPNELLDLLIYLTTPKNFNWLKRDAKKFYRLVLLELFINCITPNHDKKFNQNPRISHIQNTIESAKLILRIPKLYEEVYDPVIIQDGYYGQLLKNNYFRVTDIRDENFKIEVIKFFNDKLNMLKENKERNEKIRRFWKVKEFEEFFSVKLFFKRYDIFIKDHHWIDFNIDLGLVPTFPDLLAYNDLINNWNFIIQKRKEFISITELKSESMLKTKSYELFTLQRLSYTTCVGFFEAYLLYLFYNLHSKLAFEEEEKIKTLYSVYEKNYKSIDDESILKTIIKHKYVKTKDEEEKFSSLYSEYKKINKIRNAVAHTTAFELDESGKVTMDLYFEQDTDYEELRKTYQFIIEFVLYIESLLPEEDKVMIWWNRYPDPIFDLENELSIIR